MKVLVAPCTFKESLTASDAARILATCVRRAGHEATELPLADGGEGTLDSLRAPLGLELHRARVEGMFGQRIEAEFGLRLTRREDSSERTRAIGPRHPEGPRSSQMSPPAAALARGRPAPPRAQAKLRLALIEAASVVGLTLVEKSQRDPLRASTRGLGQLMNAAVAAGAREIWLGLGGSATIDGGAGLLSTYQHANKIPITALVDVDVPLAGARMFMAQKFAGAVDDAVLDERTAILLAMFKPYLANTPGAGAAGGLGAAIASLGGKLVGGADVVLREAHVDDAVQNADVVFTGEGRIDEQTKHGKLVAALAAMCMRHGKRLIAFCGDARGTIDGAEVVVITPRDEDLDHALARARDNLDRAGSAVISRL